MYIFKYFNILEKVTFRFDHILSGKKYCDIWVVMRK